MKYYLFVHFRETTTPDGEQVYFGLSRGGFRWEALNGGRPVLWAYYGDHGVRDMTIVRDRAAGRFHIFATDLSLSYGMRGKYANSWRNINLHGSKALAHWESEDLVRWSEEELIPLGDETFGCLWAPDILYDSARGDYLLHWSSCCAENGYGPMGIYASRTADFRTYTPPRCLYRKEGSSIIDSAMYEEDGRYYLFVKSENDPSRILELAADRPDGPFERVPRFDESMLAIQEGKYEAPTALRLEDGRWALFLDFYGARGAAQGYVPFLADSLAGGAFTRSDDAFSFPYRFKHGTVLEITEEEYERMRAHDWTQVEDRR